MKITAISDIHGDLPYIEPCDVLCICGDIVPLNIQSNYTKSVVWFAGTFVKWCESIDCAKVLIIAGNHDFMFQNMFDNYYNKYINTNPTTKFYWNWDDFASEVESNLNLTPKIEYLHNTSFTYNGVKFYGTPHIPVLRNWAFYADSEQLKKLFAMIPDDTDVLLSHSPGKDVNKTGVSLQLYNQPEFGSQELTDAIQDKHIKYWFVGHIHSGNHNLEDYNGIKVANVSMKDENYNMRYNPLTVEFKS